MKFLKFFREKEKERLSEQKQKEAEITEICKKYGIENWSINSEGLVDVSGDVFLIEPGQYPSLGYKGSRLPLDFGHISGDFTCDFGNLTTLQGAPKTVDGNFSCRGNKLTSLEGVPQKIKGRFECKYNNLETLEGGPKYVGGTQYDCSGNNLRNLKGSPKVARGSFICANNKLTSLEGAPEEVWGSFLCNNNKTLTSLKGGPRKVTHGFFCQDNSLLSLEGAPEDVKILRRNHPMAGVILPATNVNLLPNPFTYYPKEYHKYIEFIFENQQDWSLYRKDGTVYEERLNQMIEWGKENNLIK